MKRKFYHAVVLCILAVLCVFSLTGCMGLRGVIYDDSQFVGDKKVSEVIDCIQRKDREGIKSLLAPNMLAVADNIDERINELFTYYDGEYISDDITCNKSESNSYGVKIIVLRVIGDVVTTADKYRIAFKFCVRDDIDSENIGISSFYIIKYDDDPQKNLGKYHGDGTWSDGIYIGKVNATYYLQTFIECINSGNHDTIKAYFAPNIAATIEDFDDSIDEMLAFYGNYLIESTGWRSSVYNSNDNGEIITEYYDISISFDEYRMCARYYTEDTGDSGNIGMWSFYITKCDENTNFYFPYWGDETWTNGIHVDYNVTP